jgi:hypothetical protein
LYSYRGVHFDSGSSGYTCTFGKINTTTGASTSITSFVGNVQFNQGAYNTTDNNYYAFNRLATSDTLYKIGLSGTVSILDNTSTGNRYDGLVYNRVTNKLYCFRNSGGVSHIAQITVSGSTYTTTDLATTILPAMHDNATVNQASGDIYYQSFDIGTYTFSIEKYVPGATTSVTICSGMPIDLWGLRYNTVDNMLYAIRPGAVNFELLKITPSGTISTVADLGFPVNAKFHSACIDPCSNHYILSRKDINTSQGHLYQISMTGTILQHDITTEMYQGMDVKY